MNRRLSARDASLNAPLSRDDEGIEFQDTLVDERPLAEALTADRQELSFRRELLVDAMDGLSEREREIITERRLSEEPLTLEVLGQRFGISRERVRQLEVRAFEKVSKAMLAAAAEVEGAA